MKKLLIMVLSLFMIMSVGCSKEDDNSFEKYMEEGKISIANEEYDKALNFFTLAKEEKEDDELNSLYNQTKSLIEAIDSKEKENYDDAIHMCENISSMNSESNIIKEVAEKIKKECVELKVKKKDDETKKEEKSSNETSSKVSKKQYYQTRLVQVQSQVDEIENSPEYVNGDTIQLKEAVYKCYQKWDGLLNEIYGELKNQLSKNDMDNLRNEQRQWIKYRDSESEKESAEYKGGTMELLIYNDVSSQLTRERCYELVNQYVY